MSPKTPVAPREDVEALPWFCAVLERVASITLRAGTRRRCAGQTPLPGLLAEEGRQLSADTEGGEEAVVWKDGESVFCTLSWGRWWVIHVAFGYLGTREMGEASRGPTYVVRARDRPE